ncbi:hypothetical protein IPA_01325 [Ignicoccus pacificus DSM 13166]|uniref:Uncharacterized protein n=1 Tax=Ignicoccus pacificus DSM 13166 TaxID=940294 RepID=A0A977KAG8_9CREN|nr:hypothetical protein IPA_01325 [Ignicoccus pacificus DSM 13166]
MSENWEWLKAVLIWIYYLSMVIVFSYMVYYYLTKVAGLPLPPI